MSQAGRNDPCPCGSGKKYKKCCLLAASLPSGAYTQAERRSAQIALGRFGWRQEFDGDRAVAEARFWGGAVDLVPEDERPGVLEQGAVFFQDWFTTDFRLAGGRTLLEQFLEREGRGLRSGSVDRMKRLASRLTWWHTLPHKSYSRSTPQGGETCVQKGRRVQWGVVPPGQEPEAP